MRTDEHAGEVLEPSIESPRAKAARCLREWIREGTYRQGQPLPSTRELAGELGIGSATVNRALMQLETEGLVRAVSKRVRVVARSSASVSPVMQKTVLVLAPSLDILDPQHRRGGWAEAVTQGIVYGIRSENLHAFALNPNVTGEAEVKHFIDEKPRGLLVPEIFRGMIGDAAFGESFIHRFRASGIPVVAYGDSPALEQCDRVASNHRVGSTMLTQWLIERGCRRPLMLWMTREDDIEPRGVPAWRLERRLGYEDALKQASLTPLAPLIIPQFPKSSGRNPENFEIRSRYAAGFIADRLRGPDKVDALMVPSDGDVYSVSRACRLLGVEPGKDVTIVGYDNYWEDSWEREFEPFGPQATVDKQNFLCGQRMSELLLDRSRGRLTGEPVKILVDPVLVKLDSAPRA